MYVPTTYTGGKGIRRVHPYDLKLTSKGNLAIIGKFVTGVSRNGGTGYPKGLRIYLVSAIKSAQADRRSRRFVNPWAATSLYGMTYEG